MFNESKTQLICFRSSTTCCFLPAIEFNDVTVPFSDQVQHLGHILSYNLNDNADNMRVLKDMNRKANSILCLFHFADPFCKCFLIHAYCLALYNCQLWSISSKNITPRHGSALVYRDGKGVLASLTYI